MLYFEATLVIRPECLTIVIIVSLHLEDFSLQKRLRRLCWLHNLNIEALFNCCVPRFNRRRWLPITELVLNAPFDVLLLKESMNATEAVRGPLRRKHCLLIFVATIWGSFEVCL